MPAAPLTVTALVATSTLLGALLLSLGQALAPSSAVVAGLGMVVATVVASAGTLLARGRWAAPLDAAIAVTWIGVAVAAPLDGLSVSLIAVAAVAVTASLGPWLGRWVRHLPRADGPPPAAVVMLLTLVATPAAAALSSPGGIGPGAITFAGWSLLLAVALARITVGSLTAARVLHPAAAVAAAIESGWPGGLVIAAAGALVACLAWRGDVTLAVAPAAPRRGEVFAIPPELVPPEVRESAGLDQSGRPRGPR